MNVNLLLLFLSKSKSESYLRLTPHSLDNGVNRSGILNLKKSPTADEIVIAYTDADGVDQVDRYATDTEFAASLTCTDDTYIYVSGAEELKVGEFFKGEGLIRTEMQNDRTIVVFDNTNGGGAKISSCKKMETITIGSNAYDTNSIEVSDCEALENITVRGYAIKGDSYTASFDGEYPNLENILLSTSKISFNADSLPSLNLIEFYSYKPVESAEWLSEILAKTNPGGLIKTDNEELLEPIAAQYGWTVESAENPLGGGEK